MKIFHCKTKIVTGFGALSFLETLQIKRLFLVCDPYFQKNHKAEAIISASKCDCSLVFCDIVPDPSADLVAKGSAQLRQFSPDTVVALGGGSAIDSAKAMAYFSGCQPLLIAIPTTSGSGSEVTNFSILTHDGVKHPLVDDSIQPNIAILDDELVSTLPPSLIADGGFDLISHALEVVVSTTHSPISDLLAKEAFSLAFQHLYASYRGDQHARCQIHLAATLAGISFSQSGLGLCHAISHSLGGQFHIPHGRLNAILLPSVIDKNATVSCHSYAELAQKVGLSTGDNAMALRALKNGLLRLRRNLQLPSDLSQVGISPAQLRQNIPSIVRSTLSDPCCATNPRPVDSDLVESVLLEVMGHE